MKETGLYISLLPAGKVKRHLSSDLGEMPLPDTTIAEELIALTEYDSTSVMDEIRKIETLSYEVAEDIMSQQPFQHYIVIVLSRMVRLANRLHRTLHIKERLHQTE